MFCERPLSVGSSAAVSLSNVGHFRLKLTAQQVHAGRVAHGKRPRPAGIGAPRTSAVSIGSTAYTRQADEEVDAIAVLEQPGSVPSTQFEQHDQAQDMLAQLEAINAELKAEYESTEVLLEWSQWDTPTLPTEVQSDFLQVYRKTRKEQERADKEQRKKRREENRAARAAAAGTTQQQHSSAAAAAVEQPMAAPAPEQAMPVHQLQPLLQQHQPQQQHIADSFPAAPISQPVAPAQQALPLRQPLPAQPQPTQRARRARRGASGSGSGLAAPAAISSSVLNSISSSRSSTQAVPRLAAILETPAAATAAVVSPAVASPAASPAAAAAAPVAPVAGASAPKSRTARAAPKLSAMAPHSSSSSALAVAIPVPQQPQQPAAAGFAPLSILQPQQQGGLVAPATSRRLLRGTGVRRTAATSAAVVAPTMAGGKLADNTLHGLDLRAELLTGEQERDLAVMVQDLLGLESTCKELAVTLGRTPTDVEWMQAAGADTGFPDLQAALTTFQGRLHAGRNAKQVMIKANYKLVVSICRKYQGLGMNMGDLINEGIAGLVKGVEKFEPAKGFKFSTYAHWWIRQSVSRSLSDQGRLVRLPIHMQELLSKASKASKAFEAQHGRPPTAEEIAPELGVEASRIKDAWDAVVTPRSLDQPYGDAEGGTLGDIVEDDRTIGSEEAVYVESLKKDLEGVLAGLCDRDAGVLRMRFGLLDGREYTLDEVGAEFKVTRERIRQIEAKAIRQLRAHHVSPGSVMADYTHGAMSDKTLASRTSSGLKKQK